MVKTPLEKLNDTYAKYFTNPANYETEFYAALRRAINYIISNRADHSHRDDLIQDVTIRVWKRLQKFDDSRSPFGAWVRLNTNAAVKDFIDGRYRNRVDLTSDGDVESLKQEEDDYCPDADSARARLRDVFLDDPELVERLIAGDSESGAARNLGRSRDAIRWSVQKARERHAVAA